MKVGHSLCLAALSLAILTACNKAPDDSNEKDTIKQSGATESIQIAAPVLSLIHISEPTRPY